MPPWSASQLRARLPRICVAITGPDAAHMRATSADLLPAFPLQEFRLDYLDNPQSALPALAQHLQQHPLAIFLATCRPQASGGRFHGSPIDELNVLTAAAGAGFPLVDLSLESAEALGPAALNHLRQHGAAVLLSHHDFAATGDLEHTLARMRPLHPDLYKIVPTATTLRDSLTTLNFLRTTSTADPTPLIVVAMGEPGIPTRILAPSHGSAFTFAAATPAEATAPGQLTAATLTGLYRVPQITPATQIYGVAGDPIHSSLSPLMLNTAFRTAGLNAVYLPLMTSSAEELFAAARTLPLQGFSVTMPLKQAILPFLDHIDPLAARIGAVNTVHRTPDGHWHGYNTDAAGVILPLEQRLPLRNTRILVLGAGGAARAAVFACKDRGAHIFLQNRTHEKAQALAEEAGAIALPRNALATETFDVLINTTPAGMRGNPLTLPLEAHELHASLVFDNRLQPHRHTPPSTRPRDRASKPSPA